MPHQRASTPPVSGNDVGGDGPAHPWHCCLLPLVVFMAGGLVEPVPSASGAAGWLGIPYSAYPVVYSLRLAATAAAVAWCWSALRPWLGRPRWWPPLLGLGLAIPWVVLATLQRQAGWGTDLGERSGFDPFASLPYEPAAAWGFLAVRGIGLVILVPVVEELFLRGFFMRYVISERFWEVPFGTLTVGSLLACMIYAVTTHPAEAVAAAGWFAIGSGIAAATRQPIDCILAHAATNIALGGYVLATGSWWLL
jgi:CAAX prenyl protease-like protein